MQPSILVLSCERLDAFTALADLLHKHRSEFHEVIVADNSFTDETRTAIQDICEHKFTLIQRPYKPFAMSAMRNLAIDQASGDILVFLDSDILPVNDDFFDKVVDFHENHDALLIMGRYKEHDSTEKKMLPNGNTFIRDSFRERMFAENKRPWRIAASGICSIKRSVLGDIRFDERFCGAWGWEDQDFTRQLWEAGVHLELDTSIASVHYDHPREQTGRENNWAKFNAKWNAVTASRFLDYCKAHDLNPRGASNKLGKFIDYDFTQNNGDCLKVLDIGCGKGLFAHYLSCVYGVEVDTVDPYDGQGHRTEDEGINHAFKEATRDAVKICKTHLVDFRSDTLFDVAIADICLHHIATTRQRLQIGCDTWVELVANVRNVYRHMRYGGTFYVIEVLPITEENTNFEKVSKSVGFTTKHTPQEWSRVLIEAGFQDISVRYQLPKGVARTAGNLKTYGYKYVIKAVK